MAKVPGPQAEESPITDVPDAKRKREYKDFGHEEEKPTRTYLAFIHVQALTALII